MKPVVPYLRATTYGYDTNHAGDQSALKCEDKSLAQQHMADECDINKLVERFVVRGEIPQTSMPPLQGDFVDAPSYQEALNLMVEANRSFMNLPAKERARFENDPAQFVEFCSDEKNRDQLRQMGLMSDDYVAQFKLEQQRQQELIEAGKAAKAAEKASKAPPKGGAD